MAASPDPLPTGSAAGFLPAFLRRSDGLAAMLSSLCLVHCLLLPVVLVLAPGLFGLALGDDHGPEWLHWAFLLLALPFSFHALLQGHALHHRLWPMGLAGAGFVLMALGALQHDALTAEQLLTVGGGLLVALAHWCNWRLRSARPA